MVLPKCRCKSDVHVIQVRCVSNTSAKRYGGAYYSKLLQEGRDTGKGIDNTSAHGTGALLRPV